MLTVDAPVDTVFVRAEEQAGCSPAICSSSRMYAVQKDNRRVLQYEPEESWRRPKVGGGRSRGTAPPPEGC